MTSGKRAELLANSIGHRAVVAFLDLVGDHHAVNPGQEIAHSGDQFIFQRGWQLRAVLDVDPLHLGLAPVVTTHRLRVARRDAVFGANELRIVRADSLQAPGQLEALAVNSDHAGAHHPPHAQRAEIPDDVARSARRQPPADHLMDEAGPSRSRPLRAWDRSRSSGRGRNRRRRRCSTRAARSGLTADDLWSSASPKNPRHASTDSAA